MTVVTYEQIALNWRPDIRRDHTFNLVAVSALVVSLMLGVFVSSINLPKEPRDSRIIVPDRVAKYISEKPKPKPKPKIVKPKPKPIAKPKFERKKPAKRKPLTKVEKKARKKAEESGLLALTKELSDLVDTASLDSQVKGKINKNSSRDKAAVVNTKILTANSSTGSGGVSQQTKGGTGGSARLDDNQRQLARQLLASGGEIANTSSKTKGKGGSKGRGSNVRSEEDVAYVMDKNKSMLHAIYRRALRKDSSLKGKIVLEITILPSGKVSNVRIKSSELNDPKLEKSLIVRIKRFNFGAGAVKTLTLTIPIEFLPS